MAQSLYERVLDKTLRTGFAMAQGFCTSRTIRKNMRRQVLFAHPQEAKGVINALPYWSIYYHEGRKVINAQNGYLLWFRNPKDDPRLNNGEPPIYRSDVRKGLTKGQWDYWTAQNRLARKIGAPVPMIISKTSPRSGAPKFPGNPFFGNEPGEGMSPLKDAFVKISTKEAHEVMEGFLRSSGLKKKTIVRNI